MTTATRRGIPRSLTLADLPPLVPLGAGPACSCGQATVRVHALMVSDGRSLLTFRCPGCRRWHESVNGGALSPLQTERKR